MYISSLILESFKSYENITLKFDKKFNVIIGENNIGKSTIFEALQLWKKCFDLSILAKGYDFYSPSTNIYINFEDLNFIRLSEDEDILFPGKTSCKIAVVFAEEINGRIETYTLDFTLAKPNIKNAYVRISRTNNSEFQKLLTRLSALNIKLNEFIFIHQTSPVSNILRKEPYMYKGQVLKKIQKGKSDEVLRNKIIQSLEKDSDLEKWMCDVLDITFKFVQPKKSEREKKEYINLLVEKEGNKLDIYLQGSGFLQIAEIFSTIEVMDNAINILLIDEPDSHISPRIQCRLLSCLKNIDATQTFIISHNDNFVSDVSPEHILFINSTNKIAGVAEPLAIDNVDTLHMALGGIVTGLTKLQKYKTVCFVEGEDDISYIRMLSDALKRNGSTYTNDIDKVSFWYIRGKDNLRLKIMAGKQLLSQAVSGCKFNSIFDKDYSTIAANETYISRQIKPTLGSTAKIHTHNGYCIESVLFSDLDILDTYIRKLIPYALSHPVDEAITPQNIDVKHFIENHCNNLKNSISNVTSCLYLDMKSKFLSQKKPQRPELKDVEFDAFAAESSRRVQFLMNKNNIADFIHAIEQEIGGYLFERDDEESETLSSKLLINYFQTINNDDELYPSFISLLESLTV